MKGLETKKVVITGAASGIGRATAERFYKEGSSLVLVDIPSEEESELKAMFPERMTYIQADVTTTKGLSKIQSEINNGVDVFINNAGITRDATLHKMTDDQWDSCLLYTSPSPRD